ncbi:hypothetical protein Thimo_0161 [Thioflavicoccus mobilis 8321]|uniref:Uncharacterized protein n=1 Tax=Thioflavicoccus mobilis 8321 TaxID=765912 RepID=L0GST0_9GAMM|nr:hypothetical protein [Thioflavicoccus mobilis]AGA89036.1 hypothetical protein Thimo_0161 [Thioflavicoccus mobilis 8321]
MGRRAPDPLSLAAAKARLRRAAREASPQDWIRRHPGRAAATALLAGLLTGVATTSAPDKARRTLAVRLARAIGDLLSD